jgi:hypothetical protein
MIKIRGMDHSHQSDILFVLGTTLKFGKLVKNFKKSPLFVELNIFIIYSFEKGMRCE